MMVIRLLILVLFAVFVYRTIQAGRISISPIAITPPVLVFLALAFLSCMLSSYPNQSFQWLRILIGYAVFLYLFVFLVHEWNHIVKLTLVMVSMAVLEASYALVQLSGDGGRPTGTFFNPNFLAGYLVAAGTIAWGYFCFTWKSRYGIRRSGADRITRRHRRIVDRNERGTHCQVWTKIRVGNASSDYVSGRDSESHPRPVSDGALI